MKERPILCSSPMVRAILDGRMTQTRQILKHQPDEDGLSKVTGGPWVDTSGSEYRCPYGVPGDRLWVRENWGYGGCCTGRSNEMYVTYHADGLAATILCESSEQVMKRSLRQNISMPVESETWTSDTKYQWKDEAITKWWASKKSIPSIHMPRWASRITLEVTDIRVERLRDISRGDAMSEGCPYPNMADGANPVDWFCDLWESINGPASWNANPWVWVIEFKKLEAT